MAVNYIAANGQDLDDVFDFYVTGTSPAATGFILSSGVDLNTRYAPIIFGSAASATGLQISNGSDLNTLFAAKGTAAYITEAWAGTDNYCRSGDAPPYSPSVSAQVTFSIRRDGTFSITPSGAADVGRLDITPQLNGDWVLNKTSTIGDGYEVLLSVSNLVSPVGITTESGTLRPVDGWKRIDTTLNYTRAAFYNTLAVGSASSRVQVTLQFRLFGTATVISSSSFIMETSITRIP